MNSWKNTRSVLSHVKYFDHNLSCRCSNEVKPKANER